MMNGQRSVYGICNHAALSLAALALMLSGCGGETPTSPSDGFPSPRIAWNVHVIDEGSGISLYEKTDSTLVFNIETSPPHMTAGDIVIGTEGGGYIRRISAAEIDGGRLSLGTTEARLTDAVIEGGTEFVVETGFGSPREARPEEERTCAPGIAFSGGGLNVSRLVLLEDEIDGSPASITIDEGYIEFGPALTTRTVIANGRIVELLSVASGPLTADMDLSIDVPGVISDSREMLLASVRQTVVPLIGTVPIVVSIDLELYIQCEFSGTYVGACGTSFRTSCGVSLGGEYAHGAWSGVTSLEPTAYGSVLKCTDFATARMRVAVKPILTMRLYGETAALAQLSAYCDVEAETQSPPVWEWSIRGGLQGACAITPDILGTEPTRFTVESFPYEVLLGEGPYSTDQYIFFLMWGSEGTGDYQFSYPRGMSADGSGNVYVVDAWNNRIQKFAPDSTFISKWGMEGEREGEFILPASIALDAASNVYVTDSGNHRVQKFGPDTIFVTAWGERGSDPGQFDTPAGITVDASGDVYVVDSGNNRIQKFSSEGLFLTEWGSYGAAAEQFDTPIGIASDADGNVYVTDCRNNRVQKYSSNGDFITEWGTAGTGEGGFDCPVAIAVDEAGDVYVLDYGNNRLQKYDSNGILLTTLGSSGTGEGQFDRPEGIAVDVFGNVYIADSRNLRIQKFAPIP